MRTYEEIVEDIRLNQDQWDLFRNDPDSFSQDQYGQPTELVERDEVLKDELGELLQDDPHDVWNDILMSYHYGMFPDYSVDIDPEPSDWEPQ